MDALLELVEAEGVSLERVTVKQLLERSGMGRQTFYNHFLDLAWHQHLWGEEPLPDELRFATEYHALASSYMTISWVELSCNPNMVHIVSNIRICSHDWILYEL